MKFHSHRFQRNKKMHLNAFEKAHEIRKFEIELYWKRTTYFWTLIAALFAGYFLISTKTNDDLHGKDLFLMIISCTGVVFSYAWLLANKGSKFWQENWEYHLDILEDKITGPLYKKVLYKKNATQRKKISNLITRPQSVSVSKINQVITCFTFLIWVFILNLSSINSLSKLALIIITLWTLWQIYHNCKSDMNRDDATNVVGVITRETKIQ